MNKALIVSGIIYFLWGLWQSFLSYRQISLFREFSVTVSPLSYLFPVGLLIFALIQIAAGLIQIKNEKIYATLFICAISFICIWILYVVFAANYANKEIDVIFHRFI